jgi:hypothetical protein
VGHISGLRTQSGPIGPAYGVLWVWRHKSRSLVCCYDRRCGGCWLRHNKNGGLALGASSDMSSSYEMSTSSIWWPMSSGLPRGRSIIGVCYPGFLDRKGSGQAHPYYQLYSFKRACREGSLEEVKKVTEAATGGLSFSRRVNCLR